ncbi:family 1 glycosylhydrolase [Pseudooceanicola sp. GBMRC 2024]|uniref:Family 1 glycosylhydrolase n=1 Tax=Pseudooceanicola albus TaxID=2692189 RepID=A0A6L7G317_9RHOB|nr:family 1 glycosylhydrolase [Pseudooceanicola albus]MXN17898.1 family 1 glycosylhydrolase [Pseudooceanicola albus]
MITRRSLLALAAASAAAGPARAASPAAAPARDFLWGASTAPHQIEGNNTASDLWFIENQQPSIFRAPSGDACNSFALWEEDLELARALGLNCYRFGVEWARIEPVRGRFSQAMLDHYARLVDGCLARGLAPVVTFNHFTAPLWFSAMGGWTSPEAPALFARYCAEVARAFGDRIAHALTLNEPNLMRVLTHRLPPQVWQIQTLTNQRAAERLNVPRFVCANVMGLEDLPEMEAGMLAGHKAGRAAIRSVRADLSVGLSLAMIDDQAEGAGSMRDAVRAACYDSWLEAAQADDFIGVQTYERLRWGKDGPLPPPAGAPLTEAGVEVWPRALEGTVRYAHARAGVPVLVTENGIGTSDDNLRARFLPEAIAGLRAAMADGVPVLGYCVWSLLDNFEWISGYGPKYGLYAVDFETFERRIRPSAAVYAGIVRG